MHQSRVWVAEKESLQQKILLLGAEIQPVSAGSVEIVQAPGIASYLSRAVSENFDLLVLCLFTPVHQERDALVELCGLLRTNRHSREKPLIAVVGGRHRELLNRLEKVGVRYVMTAGPGGDDLHLRLANLDLPLSNACRVESLLMEICPFVNYLPINSCRELILCGAYRNRLVLGPHRLAQRCEVPAHLTCEYYQSQAQRKPAPSLGGNYQCRQ
jgi:hypothetical protein